MYTSKSIRLHTRCQDILELIRQNNNRLSLVTADLNIYRTSKNEFSLTRLMNKESDFTIRIARYETLGEWLILRYQNAMIELNEETVKQLGKELAA